MKILPHELPRRKRTIDELTDAELDAMTWVEISPLCGVSTSTLSHRVNKRGMTRREAATRPTDPPRSEIRLRAEAAGLSYDTVASRLRRNPGMTLTEAVSYGKLEGTARSMPGIEAKRRKAQARKLAG